MSQTSKTFSLIIGIVMVASMLASTVLPLLTGGVSNTLQATPEPTVAPTVTPPPPPDTSSIAFDSRYLHPSAMFSVAVPTGWTPTSNIVNANNATVSMNNGELLSVIEVEVIPSAYESAESLNNLFTDEWMQTSWSRYRIVTQADRVIQDDKLQVDFTLSQGARTYIARHSAWTDGEWVYVVRVVALENASAMLRFIVDELGETIEPNKFLATTPFDWRSYFDTEARHLIRFPSSLQVEDAAAGALATITGDDVVVVVESSDASVADEAAAQAWVEGWRSGVEVLSTTAVEQLGGNGFKVAYELTSLDGDKQSGVAVLLNGEDGKLHVANARVNEAGVNFNELPEDSAYQDVMNALGSFAILPDLNVTQ